MTLPSSGTLSLSDLQTEFTGSHPISMSEYYKSGGNGYVPTTVPETVTASSLGGSNSAQPGERTPAFGGYVPQINTYGRLYTQALWGDNGSQITVDRTFTVSRTGTYQYYVSYYNSAGYRSGTMAIYVGGSLIRSYNFKDTYVNTSYFLPSGPAIASNDTNTLSVTAGQQIRIVCDCASGGWACAYVYVGGSSYNNAAVNTAVNSGIPTSGALDISDFYGGRGT